MRHVALLRGIGPGNPKMRNVVLVDVLASLGLDDVGAVISSGNYVFTSAERDRGVLEDRIEAALHEHLGAPCSTIVRSSRQIGDLCRRDPFAGEADGHDRRCNVTFLKHPPTAASVSSLPTRGDGYEVLGTARRAVFFVVDDTRSTTPDVMRALERAFGTQITTRTWKSVQRIRDRLDR